MAVAMRSNGDGGGMDPKLWGELGNHIELAKNIYSKLPIQEFCRLRVVCKEWNRLSRDRKFLESCYTSPIPKPYFCLRAEGRDRLHALLSYDAGSKCWNCTRFFNIDYRSGILDVNGMIYSISCNNYGEQEVYNVHTRYAHSLPLPVEESLDLPFAALKVDKSIHPYEYVVAYGNNWIPTQVYDSKTNSWTAKPGNRPVMGPGRANCAECNGIMYIRSELDEMTTYDLEKDEWAYMDPPGGDCDDYLRSIGVWQGRLYDVCVEIDKKLITAWELVDRSTSEWKPYARMPEDLFTYIAYGDNPDPPVDPSDIQILTNFCDEYVLVWTWLMEENLAERFVMFNLDTHVWEKVEIPWGSCSLDKELSLK
jgi:hypothetical protein